MTLSLLYDSRRIHTSRTPLLGNTFSGNSIEFLTSNLLIIPEGEQFRIVQFEVLLVRTTVCTHRQALPQEDAPLSMNLLNLKIADFQFARPIVRRSYFNLDRHLR